MQRQGITLVFWIMLTSLGWTPALQAGNLNDAISPGAGAKVAGSAQRFIQGNSQFTENSLNLEVFGKSFFVLGGSIRNPAGAVRYARKGTFHIDHNGYLVNDGGKPLLAYQPNDPRDAGAGFRTGIRDTIKINTSRTMPSATTGIDLGLNLFSGALPPEAMQFSTLDPNSYNYATSVNIFDSLGAPHTVTSYFVRVSADEAAPQAIDANGNPIGGAVWKMYVDVDNAGGKSFDGAAPTGVPLSLVDGATAVNPIYLEFDTSGYLVPPAVGENMSNNSLTSYAQRLDGTMSDPPIPGAIINFLPTLGAAPLSFTLNLTGSTQFYTPNSVNSLTQNGYAIVKLTGIAMDESGVIYARYNNGSAKVLRVLGAVALAKFQNPQGLSKLGDAEWEESTASGAPLFGEADIRQVWQATFRRFEGP
ncbi:MAG: flagellar hook-basal body complex protein [Methylococcaceae bacterium]|nr:MAG: flagellar hook-basal body complex protein [Methylococcaceae bacterium]